MAVGEGKLADHPTEGASMGGKLSDFRAVSTISITAIGLGILTLPTQISEAGPWLFSFILVLAGWASWYNVVVFQRSLGLKSRLISSDLTKSSPVYESYVEVAEGALGSFGRALGVFVNHGSLLGICSCLMMIFGSVMDRMFPLADTVLTSIRWWVLIGTVAAQPAVWIRSLKKVSVLGTAGVSAMLLLTILIVTAGLAEYDKHNVNSSNSTSTISSSDEEKPRNHKVDMSELGMVKVCAMFATIVFAFGAIPIVPAVSKDLRVPGHFMRVSVVSYVLIALLNATVAGVGFLGWGTTLNPQGILAQLQGPRDLKKGMSAVGWLTSLLALVVVFTHIIVLIRPVSDAMEKLGNRVSVAGGEVARKVARSLPSLVMMTVGLFAQDVGAAIEFVAAFTVLLLCILLPPVFYLVLKFKVMKTETTESEVGGSWTLLKRLAKAEKTTIMCSTVTTICGLLGMSCVSYSAFKQVIK